MRRAYAVMHDPKRHVLSPRIAFFSRAFDKKVDRTQQTVSPVS
jgi:hypothetical protein